jgi:hypothetical protein
MQQLQPMLSLLADGAQTQIGRNDCVSQRRQMPAELDVQWPGNFLTVIPVECGDRRVFGLSRR